MRYLKFVSIFRAARGTASAHTRCRPTRPHAAPRPPSRRLHNVDDVIRTTASDVTQTRLAPHQRHAQEPAVPSESTCSVRRDVRVGRVTGEHEAGCGISQCGNSARYDPRSSDLSAKSNNIASLLPSAKFLFSSTLPLAQFAALQVVPVKYKVFFPDVNQSVKRRRVYLFICAFVGLRIASQAHETTDWPFR